MRRGGDWRSLSPRISGQSRHIGGHPPNLATANLQTQRTHGRREGRLGQRPSAPRLDCWISSLLENRRDIGTPTNDISVECVNRFVVDIPKILLSGLRPANPQMRHRRHDWRARSLQFLIAANWAHPRWQCRRNPQSGHPASTRGIPRQRPVPRLRCWRKLPTVLERWPGADAVVFARSITGRPPSYTSRPESGPRRDRRQDDSA